MGISLIKKKLLNETNNLYSEDEIKEFQKLSREQGLDIVEYVKNISNNEEEELLKQFNSFGGEVTSYIDWENKRTREILGEIYTSKLGYLSRDVRNHLVKNEGKDIKDIYKNTSSLFFNIINKIEDNQLFWVVFGWFYQTYELSSLRLKEFENCISEERLSIRFYERSLLGNTMWLIHRRLFESSDSYSVYENFDEAKQRIVDLNRTNEQFYSFLFVGSNFKNLIEKSDDDEVKMYRGFKVDIKDKEMRIMDKENNKQLNGIGLSYSFKRQKCIYFGTRWTSFDLFIRTLIFSKVYSDEELENSQNLGKLYENLKHKEGLDWKRFTEEKEYRDNFLRSDIVKRITEDSEKHHQSSQENMDNKVILREIENYNKDTRGYVGDYSCKKKDIIMFSDYGGEDEIVVLSNKTKMLSYQVITYEEYSKSVNKWVLVSK